MEWGYEENVLSILRGREEWNENYSSMSEFILHLNEETTLAHEMLYNGYVFCRPNERQHQYQQHHDHHHRQQSQIIALLKGTASDHVFCNHYILQFWGVVKVEGRHHHLSSSHLPFCVSELKKGFCRYRKLCRDHVYVVDMEGGDEEQHGCVGRAYKSKNLVSSPDLRLYSTHEFPMRDDAARCNFRGYMALPLFDFHTHQYYGVLEFMCYHHRLSKEILSSFDRALKIAGLKSTHSLISTSYHVRNMDWHPESEITDIIELALATDPRLYLAQVWVPCKECIKPSSNLCCMEMAYNNNPINRVNRWGNVVDDDMSIYLEACKFHHLQIDVCSCYSNLCDASISRNPLAHFAQRARVSHCFPISLQSITNSSHLYVIQFFLQPKFRNDAYNDYSPQLLSKIVEMNLKSFKFLEDSQKPNAVESRSIDSLNVLKSYEEKISELDFIAYLEMAADSCRLRPCSEYSDQGWVFRCPNTAENDVSTKEKIENFMKNMAVRYVERSKWIVQFWAPKMEEDRCRLEAFDQPYAVSCLSKGIAYFRKKCMTHYYLVDDKAKEEELGPPGRVFTYGFPEITPNLFYYTRKEFLIKNYARSSINQQYLALPIFDDERFHKCVGVLEFLGFYCSDIECLGREVEVANMYSIHIDYQPTFLANEPQPIHILEKSGNVESVMEISLHPDTELDEMKYRRTNTLIEIKHAIELIRKNIPQLHMANVWVPNEECFAISSNMSCMELALSTKGLGSFMPMNQIHRMHVHIGKGMVGLVLASKNKSCFCRNLYEFSMVHQPLSHFQLSDRRNICFAICLQSSRTGDLVYVLEFFLYQGPATCEYLRSFLNFLLPIMKNELKSFKMASGKQLGEELVVEVIEFSEGDKLDSFESKQVDVFPIKFKSVQYNQEEQQQMEECNLVALDSKKRETGKRKTLSLDLLKPYFGKKLKDVAEELDVGRSTIKRACRNYGIDRWPCTEKQKKNLSLFGRESGGVSQQETKAESSHHANVQEEAEKMIIKVKYEEDIIKFEFCLSLGLTKIIEEAASRLNLEKGGFKLKYLDEDDDEILLTRDDDLQLCPKSRTATGRTCIQLLVRF